MMTTLLSIELGLGLGKLLRVNLSRMHARHGMACPCQPMADEIDEMLKRVQA
jgi:hypothetical protein